MYRYVLLLFRLNSLSGEDTRGLIKLTFQMSHHHLFNLSICFSCFTSTCPSRLCTQHTVLFIMTKNDNIAQPRAEREAGRLEAAGPSDRTPSPGLSSSSISTVDRPIPANPTRLQSVKELSSLDSFSPFFTFHVPVPYTQPIRFADLSQPFPPAPQPQQRVESPPPAYSERSIGKRERDTSSPQPPPGVNIDADAEPKAKAAKTKATSTRERAPQPIEVAKKKGKTNVPARLPDELLNSFSSAVKYVRKIPILPAFPLPPLPVISDPRVAEEAFRRDAMMGKRNHDMLAMIGDGLAELYMREYAYGFTPQIENGLTTVSPT